MFRMDAPSPVPDHVDWRQIALDGCAECGYQPVSPDRVPGRIRDTILPWRDVLHRRDAAVRPAPGVWSPLEYGCHVRDLCGVFAERVDAMLGTLNPVYPEFDGGLAAVERRYADDEPTEVAEAYARAAESIARRFIAIPRADWNRRGRRSDGPAFTIATLSNHFLHELEHHLVDVGARRS